jgi:hypothetical protein
MKKQHKFNLDTLIESEYGPSSEQERYEWIPMKRRLFGLIKPAKAFLMDKELFSRKTSIDNVDREVYNVEFFGVQPFITRRAYVKHTFSNGRVIINRFDTNSLANKHFHEVMDKPFITH